MPFEIPDHFNYSFTQNVELLLQEKMPMLMMACETRSYQGDRAQVVKQFGEVQFKTKDQRHSNTQFDEIEHRQRWLFPVSATLALPIDQEDELRMLDSAAWARRVNETIRDAALGTAQTGVTGGTITNFDTTNQRIVSSSVGLTIAKVRTARRKLAEANNDMQEERFLIVKPKQMDDLLKTTEATDENYADVKALVDGRVNRLLGFNVIEYTNLSQTGGEDRVIAMVKSAVVMGQWNGLTMRIGERSDKDYLTQVHGSGTIAATRTQEGKVVEILCA
jgi:hypothetical protein